MKKFFSFGFLFSASGHSPVILVRLMVGFVFLVSGLQKFIFPEMGPGRFADMGYAYPVFTAYFVAFFEAAGGLFILIGLAVRLFSIPIAIIMAVAIITTKIPRIPEGGWVFLQSVRLDFSMLLGALFLVWSGGDRFSLDARIRKRFLGPSKGCTDGEKDWRRPDAAKAA